jgi:3-hydroxybutyrate dehydrogenase
MRFAPPTSARPSSRRRSRPRRARGISPATVINDVILEANAVKRLIEPNQIADFVCYICGPAAWTMTGSVAMMDAGWLAH